MKILKTSLTTLVVSAAMTATQAFAGVMTQTTMPAPIEEPAYFDGLYVGVGAGLAKPNAKVQYDYMANMSLAELGDVNEIYSGAKSQDSGKYGFGASIFAGFGKVFDSTTYLGAEIFGNYFEPDMTLSSYTTIVFTPTTITGTGNFKTNVDNDYSYGILARAGYLFSPKTMFYILFGIEGSEFDIKSTANFTTTGGAPDLSDGNVVDKFDKHRIGYLPGIGMSTVIGDQITLDMRYVYAFYSSFEHTFYDTTNLIEKTYTTKVDPSRGYLSLMLSWFVG